MESKLCKECSGNSEDLYEGYKDGRTSGGNLNLVFPRCGELINVRHKPHERLSTSSVEQRKKVPS